MNLPRIGYLYDTNEQTMLLTQCLDVTLSNPAGNNKKIIIEGYAFINQGNVMMMAKFMHMPTTNLPTTQITPTPYHMDTDISNPGNTAVFKYSVKAATSRMSGGTTTLSIPIKPSDRNYIESTPLTILPGVTVGLSISPGVAVSGLTVVIYTREENL